jgi:hypothetical protein
MDENICLNDELDFFSDLARINNEINAIVDKYRLTQIDLPNSE